MLVVDKVREAAKGGVRQAVAAIVAALLLLVAPSAVMSQPVTTNEAVARLFQQEIDPNWFAPSFLAQVPREQIVSIIAGLTGRFGPLIEVTGTGASLTTRLEQAEMPTQIALDGAGRIVGLLFGAPVPVGADLNGLIEEIAALPGQASVLVLTDGEVAAGYQPELTLGVGSAFKLAVLAALADEIEAGRSWDDVVALDAAWRSHPSGILQSWPEGTPVTLATLANLMISVSDNTAADALVNVLGRERVEAESPRNAPFMTTGEMFRLKTLGNEQLAAAWLDGDESARRAVLAEIDAQPLPPVDRYSTQPILGIEWFFNAFELCALLDRVADVPAFAINPGLAAPSDWTSIAFKGGSEPGVLNLSTRVAAADGTTHCVVATWNNTDALDEQALFSLYAGLLSVLADGG